MFHHIGEVNHQVEVANIDHPLLEEMAVLHPGVVKVTDHSSIRLEVYRDQGYHLVKD